MTDEPDDDLAGLNTRERAFVHEYLIDLNQTQAAIRAGYSAKTANTKGYQLFAKVGIKAAIQKRIDERWRASIMKADEVQARLSKQARFTMRGLIKTENGAPVVDLENATEDQLDCITEASLSETGVLKIKGPNVQGALAHMAKIHGLFVDKVEHSVDSDFAAKMAAAMARARPAEGGAE